MFSRIGIFAKTFAPGSLADILDSVVSHGLTAVHFNMVCAGLPAMPDDIPPALAEGIREETQARRLEMAAVSGTYNMIHPDTAERAKGIQRLEILAGACKEMGTDTISLCTGTRDPDDQWRRHRDNDRPDAWRDLTAEMEKALEIAERHKVKLAIEPEQGNVVNSAEKAETLMAQMASSHLKVILDPANLLLPESIPQQREIMDEAFGRLGPHIVMAHAKDIAADGRHVAAGNGVLDYPYYVRKLRELPTPIPLIIHGLAPTQVPHTLAFLKNLITDA